MLAGAALLLGGAQTEAGSAICPAPTSDGVVNSGETNWSASYKGRLVSVEMRTESTGDKRGEATIYCRRSVGAVSMTGRNCRLTPGAGGRIAARTETGAQIVTCTLLGTSGTNDTACFMECD